MSIITGESIWQGFAAMPYACFALVKRKLNLVMKAMRGRGDNGFGGGKAMLGDWFLGKEGGRALHDAHISKSRYGAPGTRLSRADLGCIGDYPWVVADESRRGNV